MVIHGNMLLFERLFHDRHARNSLSPFHSSAHHSKPYNVISNILHAINQWLFDFYQKNANFLDPIYDYKEKQKKSILNLICLCSIFFLAKAERKFQEIWISFVENLFCLFSFTHGGIGEICFRIQHFLFLLRYFSSHIRNHR